MELCAIDLKARRPRTMCARRPARSARPQVSAVISPRPAARSSHFRSWSTITRAISIHVHRASIRSQSCSLPLQAKPPKRMQPQFTKFHGLGNDYLVIEAEQLSEVRDLGEVARRICNRHYGAGGDGIAIIARAQPHEADFSCRIFNPDGREAGLSGNGTRCAVAYLYYKQLWTKEELRLSTRTGLKRYFLRGEPSPGKFLFESELGQPKFDTGAIPMSVTPP